MRIIACLTTLPKRIKKIHKVIKSIVNQTRKLDKIYINIPYKTMNNQPYTIPSFFYHYKKEIEIIRCDDFGPITKILPVLDIETDPNTYIVTLDDDIVIHKDVIKILEKRIKKYPNSALSFSGWCIGSFPCYIEFFNKLEKDKEVDWLQGTNAILYPRYILDKNKIVKFMQSLPKFMIKHDDHILCAYLEIQKIKKIVLKEDSDKYFLKQTYSNIDSVSGMSLFKLQVILICIFFYKKGLYFRDPNKNKNLFLISVVICLMYGVNKLSISKKILIFGIVLFFSRWITYYASVFL